MIVDFQHHYTPKELFKDKPVDGKTLNYEATVGSLPVFDEKGKTIADVMYIAYTMPGANRSVTFALNGGPGASSVYLNFGAIGPKRVQFGAEGNSPSDPANPIDNAGSWLDFTDLVFIDPVGTGFSRPVGKAEEAKKKFYTTSADIEYLSRIIYDWSRRNDRSASPKLIVGESYGGFRAPRIAHLLQTRHGVGINAIVLVSPVLDFEGRRGGHSPLLYANVLPSLAAAALERNGSVPSRAALKDIEEQARLDHLADLMRGPRDKEAVDRVVARVVRATGLPEETVRRYGGRLGGGAYVREMNRAQGRIASSYDASVTGYDPDPSSANSRYEDPFTGVLRAPMTTAMTELYATKLGWRPDRPYVMQSSEAHGAWLWLNSPNAPESVGDLRNVLALNERLRVLVAHGFTDLVTPYLATERVLAQLPPFGDATRVRLMVYPGGHMFYSRDASRAAFRDDAQRLLEEALVPVP